VKYKHEIDGRVDYLAGGTTLAECKGLGPDHNK